MQARYWLPLLLLLTACTASEQPQQPTHPVKDKPMPSFQMQTLDGNLVNSHARFAGKVVILNVWATWCPPCRKEMPDLIRLSRLLPSNQFAVIGLAVDQNDNDVRAFIAQHHIPFPIFWDRGGKQVAAPVLGTFKYPETYIINRRGILIDKVIGAFPWAAPRVVALLHAIYKTGHVPTTK